MKSKFLKRLEAIQRLERPCRNARDPSYGQPIPRRVEEAARLRKQFALDHQNGTEQANPTGEHSKS